MFEGKRLSLVSFVEEDVDSMGQKVLELHVDIVSHGVSESILRPCALECVVASRVALVPNSRGVYVRRVLGEDPRLETKKKVLILAPLSEFETADSLQKRVSQMNM